MAGQNSITDNWGWGGSGVSESSVNDAFAGSSNSISSSDGGTASAITGSAGLQGCYDNKDCSTGYNCVGSRCEKASSGVAGSAGAGNCSVPVPPTASTPIPCGSISGGTGGGCTKPGCGQPLPRPNGTIPSCREEVDGDDGSDNNNANVGVGEGIDGAGPGGQPEGNIIITTEGNSCSHYCDQYYRTNGVDADHFGCNKDLRCNTLCESCSFFSERCEKSTSHCSCDGRSPACSVCDQRTGSYYSTDACWRRYCKRFICTCNGDQVGGSFEVCVNHNLFGSGSGNEKVWEQASEYCRNAQPCYAPEGCKEPIQEGDTSCDCYRYSGTPPPCPEKRRCQGQGSMTIGDVTLTFRKECVKNDHSCKVPPTDPRWIACRDCETCNDDGKCVRDPVCDEEVCPSVCGQDCCVNGGECVTISRYQVADPCHNAGFTFCSSDGFDTNFVEYVPKANAICNRAHTHTDIYAYSATGTYVLMGRNLDGGSPPYKIGTCGQGCPPGA